MSLLDAWVRTYRQTRERSPEVATALALQLLETPSPFARRVNRDVEVETDGTAADVALIGPRTTTPARELEPLARHVMIFEEFDYRVLDNTGASVTDLTDTRMGHTLRFVFGNDETERPALPRFTLSYYQPQLFGAIKPKLIIPRGEDLRAILAKASGAAAGAVRLSVTMRLEPQALLEAAGLVEPDTVGKEGRLA